MSALTATILGRVWSMEVDDDDTGQVEMVVYLHPGATTRIVVTVDAETARAYHVGMDLEIPLYPKGTLRRVRMVDT